MNRDDDDDDDDDDVKVKIRFYKTRSFRCDGHDIKSDKDFSSCKGDNRKRKINIQGQSFWSAKNL